MCEFLYIKCTFFALKIQSKAKERFIWCMKFNVGIGKPRTYNLLKKTFGLANHLKIVLDRNQGKVISSFTVSVL